MNKIEEKKMAELLKISLGGSPRENISRMRKIDKEWPGAGWDPPMGSYMVHAGAFLWEKRHALENRSFP